MSTIPSTTRISTLETAEFYMGQKGESKYPVHIRATITESGDLRIESDLPLIIKPSAGNCILVNVKQRP